MNCGLGLDRETEPGSFYCPQYVGQVGIEVRAANTHQRTGPYAQVLETDRLSESFDHSDFRLSVSKSVDRGAVKVEGSQTSRSSLNIIRPMLKKRFLNFISVILIIM